MSKNEKKNGKKMEKDPEEKRDEKGRFLPGYSGGPGRGKTAEIDDFRAEAKKIISDLMKSKDEKIKVKGVELYMKHKGYLDEQPSIIDDPDILRAMERYANDNVLDVELPDFTDDTVGKAP